MTDTTTSGKARPGARLPTSHPTPERRFSSAQLGWLLLALAAGFLVVMPLIQLLVRAFSDAGTNFDRIKAIPNLDQTILNTIFLGLGSAALAVVLGTALAWWTWRLPRRWRGPFSIIPMMPLIIPAAPYVMAFSFLLTPKVGYVNKMLRATPFFSGLDSGPIDVFSIPWIVIITGVSLAPFVFLFVFTSLRDMSGQYEAAAAACGASATRSFFTVTLPLIRPAVTYSAGVVTLMGVGQFTVPLLLGRQRGINVITTEMFHVRDSIPIEYGIGAMLGLPLLAVGLIVVFLQQRIVGDQRRFVVRTGKADPGGGFSSSYWPMIPLLGFAVVAVIVPLLALVLVALSPFWSGTIDFSVLTLRHLKEVLFENDRTVSAIWTSLRYSAIAMLVVVPIGFFAALAHVGRTRVWGPVRRAIDIFVTMPLGVPAAIFGFAILFTYTQAPLSGLYGSGIVIILAYATLMLPYATRTQLGTLLSMGGDFVEASKVAGAGVLRTMWSITIPLARRGIAAAAALIAIFLFHEFTVSVMTVPPRTQVMGTILFEFWSIGSLPLVAAMSLIMVVVTLLGVVAAVALGGRSILERS